MLITVTLQSRERRKSTPGLLNQAEERSARVSLALLFGRLMMSVLFLYVGLSELHRLLFQPYTPYLPGDGHDVVWPKAVELLLAVPFTLGFKMEARGGREIWGDLASGWRRGGGRGIGHFLAPLSHSLHPQELEARMVLSCLGGGGREFAAVAGPRASLPPRRL